MGDLEEEFTQIHQRDPVEGRRWYWAQAIRALGPSAKRHLSPSSDVRGLAPDARLAFRSLRRRPGLVAICVATLGLGIGAATAIFSVADVVLLRPLPYPESDRLVAAWNTFDTWRGHEVLDPFWDRIELSYPEYIDWRAEQESFEEVAIYGTALMALTGNGEPSQVAVGRASAPLFPLLGARPHSGRIFLPGDDGPGAPRIAVVSYELWRDR